MKLTPEQEREYNARGFVAVAPTALPTLADLGRIMLATFPADQIARGYGIDAVVLQQ